MYENTSALVVTPEGNTDIFQVDTGVLQRDPLAPFFFIICLDYTLSTSIFPPDRLTLNRERSRGVPPEKLAKLAFADDIALIEDTINKAESHLHKIETATQKIGLFLYASKTKATHFNPSVECHIHALNGDEIEKVDVFLYLGGYTNSSREINTRIEKSWNTLNSLEKIWNSRITTETKVRIFKSTFESIQLYGFESWVMNSAAMKKIDGTYTRMLQRVKNISWRDRLSNAQLYSQIPKLSTIIKRRRLALAGHVGLHNEPAKTLLFWTPEEYRKRGRPNITLKDVLHENTGLTSNELRTAMADRQIWRKNYVMSLK